jgi:heme-degrading monooxygenase HmoA
MYVRSTTVSGDPSKLDQAIEQVRRDVVPTVSGLPGSQGVAMMVDRDTGAAAVVSFWADRESAEASESSVRPLRERAVEMMGGGADPASVGVHVYELLDGEAREQPAEGCWNRIITLELDRADIDTARDAFRSTALPALEAMDGYCAAALLADRENGRAVAVITWRDRAAVDASRDRATVLREEVTGKANARVASVAEMELVVAAPPFE